MVNNKMDNPRFIDEETIALVHQEEDRDEYNTPNTSRIEESSFIEPEATAATLALQLWKRVKRSENTALYRHLNVYTEHKQERRDIIHRTRCHRSNIGATIKEKGKSR